MALLAFKDAADGYYQIDLPDGQPLPAWAENMTPCDVVQPNPVASVAACSPWQIRKALNDLGLRDAVEAAVSSSGNQQLKDGWEYATEFRSDDPFVLSMGAALGKASDETREMIAFAATL